MPIILELNLGLFCNLILFAFFIKSVESVPDDYCLTPLNRSNCGFPPTPVFQYYKSGSRCEIQFWRGCPTANLFRNEYDCSHHCIGRLWKSASKENIENDVFGNEELLKEEENPCDEDIPTFRCTDRKQMIFTYDKREKACIQKAYYGCATRNKFSDQERCEEACQKDKLKWENIDDLNEKELEDINDMLEKVNEDFKTTTQQTTHHTTYHTTHHITHHRQQLKHFKHKTSTTTAATETPSTSVVTDKPTEVSTASEITDGTTAITHASEITDKTTKSTHTSKITASLTEATRAIELTQDTTEATQASKITVETTKITETTTNMETENKNEPHRGSIEESDIVRSKHKSL